MTTGRSRSDSAVERWVVVILHTLHLAGVVGVGAAVVAGQPVGVAAAALTFASGLALFVADQLAGRIALHELAGLVVVIKLALVAWMALDARQAAWIFWTLLGASSISSHAPKGFRHWPTKR